MTTETLPQTDAPTRPTFLGLPLPNYLLSGFATFDALAFYGMQTILIYYIYFASTDGGLEMSMGTAIGIVSAFSASTFLATIFGGWLADRVLGSGRALRWGACLAVLGYLALACIPGPVGLAVGLVGVCLGAASMWVSEGALVSRVLDGFPAKREAGFTIFYLGSATGAMLGILLSGSLQSGLGFQIGFVASAVALAIGLAIYLPLRTSAEGSSPSHLEVSRARSWGLVLPLAAAVAVILGLIAVVAAGMNPSIFVSAGSFLIVTWSFISLFTSKTITPAQKRRIRSYIPIFVATMAFALLYQQLYTTVAVHSEARTDRMLFGFEIPPSSILSVAPFCTLLMAPLLAAVWGKLGERQPSMPVKFAWAFGLCAVALGVLALSASTESPTPLIVLVLLVFVFGSSDVVLSPSGISLATEVAPPGQEGRLLSLHYVGVSCGTALAGLASGGFEVGPGEGIYFGAVTLVAVAIAAMMVIVAVQRRRVATGGASQK